MLITWWMITKVFQVYFDRVGRSIAHTPGGDRMGGFAAMTDPVAALRRWALWRSPAPVLALVIAVYLASGAAFIPLDHISTQTWIRLAALACAGSLCSLLCLRMERARKTLEEGHVPNLLGCWTFAGALCLGHTAAAVLVAVIYGVQWFTQRSIYVGVPYRYVFSAGTVVVSAWAVQLVHNPLLAGALYMATNAALVAAAMAVSGNARVVWPMLSDIREQSIVVGSMVLGYATASLTDIRLAYCVAPIPVILLVQYVSLLSHSRRSQTIDAETGVLTTRAWHALASLRLAQRSGAIVFVVLVQDFNGRSLRDCADAVREGVRPEDLIGRTDGGLSVLVAEPGGTLLANALGAQIRSRIAGVGIDSVLGSAVTPDGGSPVDLQGLTVTAAALAIVQASNSRV